MVAKTLVIVATSRFEIFLIFFIILRFQVPSRSAICETTGLASLLIYISSFAGLLGNRTSKKY